MTVSTKRKPPPGTKLSVVWITKHALTRGEGVYRVENAVLQYGDTIYVEHGHRDSFFRGNEWHATEEAAKARVKVMVASRRKAMAIADKKLQTILDTLDTTEWPVKMRPR